MIVRYELLLNSNVYIFEVELIVRSNDLKLKKYGSGQTFGGRCNPLRPEESTYGPVLIIEKVRSYAQRQSDIRTQISWIWVLFVT